MSGQSDQAPCPMAEEPRPEHHWLGQLVGTWAIEGQAMMTPGEEPAVFQGTETVRSLDGLWVIGEGHCTNPDGDEPMTSILTLGYDPRAERYAGTFVASMMSHLWLYRGLLDPDGKTLTLDTEGPDVSTGGQSSARFQDIIEIEDADHRTLTSRMRGEDGQWRPVMAARYRRT